ncbi:hypothetical protein AcV7_001285 [Taiwanofungus camphoratus]|nr:hypothetical protein AcW2_000212 [Antrodia cinnamomea]KAI0962444.1 hypothetical protein AcV7_001285 [Antrodia cinnamomea]
MPARRNGRKLMGSRQRPLNPYMAHLHVHSQPMSCPALLQRRRRHRRPSSSHFCGGPYTPPILLPSHSARRGTDATTPRLTVSAPAFPRWDGPKIDVKQAQAHNSLDPIEPAHASTDLGSRDMTMGLSVHALCGTGTR